MSYSVNYFDSPVPIPVPSPSPFPSPSPSPISTSTFSTSSFNSDVDDLIYDWHLRMSWISLLTLWIFWSLVWTFRNFLLNKKESPDLLEEVINTAVEVSQKAMMIPAINEWPQRLENAHQMVKDVLISLVCLLSINTVAHAASYDVMIVAWLITSFAIFWCVVELIIDNRLIRLVYSIIFFILGLVFIGITFRTAHF
ncbi:hypothetical protein A0J61_05392 [Choanephora cucurbitarum]|uniref:Transmembrane protein n=1 Tax=Choanephora cucurbitarum TaxID=101091 RepID=A0A1C7NGQ3_9FUNG|nr:hypothetical protein A0J61_05392 [Choanephora cucurbitarum]